MNDELQKLMLEYFQIRKQRDEAKKRFEQLSIDLNNVNYAINTILDGEEEFERETAKLEAITRPR